MEVGVVDVSLCVAAGQRRRKSWALKRGACRCCEGGVREVCGACCLHGFLPGRAPFRTAASRPLVVSQPHPYPKSKQPCVFEERAVSYGSERTTRRFEAPSARWLLSTQEATLQQQQLRARRKHLFCLTYSLVCTPSLSRPQPPPARHTHHRPRHPALRPDLLARPSPCLATLPHSHGTRAPFSRPVRSWERAGRRRAPWSATAWLRDTIPERPASAHLTRAQSM